MIFCHIFTMYLWPVNTLVYTFLSSPLFRNFQATRISTFTFPPFPRLEVWRWDQKINRYLTFDCELTHHIRAKYVGAHLHNNVLWIFTFDLNLCHCGVTPSVTFKICRIKTYRIDLWPMDLTWIRIPICAYQF